MIVICIGLLFTIYITLVVILKLKRTKNKLNDKIKVAFFHPFCNDGGGGQKVLWCIVRSILDFNNSIKQSKTQKAYEIAIYSLQQNYQAIKTRTKDRFNIILPDLDSQQGQNFKIIYIPNRSLLTPKRFLTMIFHIILPSIYTLKCLWDYQPDIFYDTTGFAFNFILVKLLCPGIRCMAYVHYPFISVDMIEKIQNRRADFNNQQKISQSNFLSKLKVYYYKLILFIYRLVRYFVTDVQANSTWTYDHINQLWGKSLKNKLITLYPPCSIKHLLEDKGILEKFDHLKSNQNELVITSLAQFRPEKNQKLQIKIFSQLSKKINRKMVLNICGTTRGSDDQRILQELRNLAKQLKTQNINFKVNLPFSGIIKNLKESHIGIHTMQAEHFGISIVEMLAAGLLVVAHSSAGPKLDIIKDEDYLAIQQEDYLKKLLKIVSMNSSQMKKKSFENQQKMKNFGQQQFMNRFILIFSQATNNNYKEKSV